MSKHTPGPLTTRRCTRPVDGEYDYAIVDAAGEVIAETFGRTSTSNRPNAEANACLFAAAPDLLKLLREMVGLAQIVEAREYLNARGQMTEDHRYVDAVALLDRIDEELTP